MCFSERRTRAGRRQEPHRGAHGGAVTAAMAAIAAATTLLTAGTAAAAPLDEPFVGGMSFTGPTAANLGAVYWNPAALGLVRGFQLMVAASAHPSTVDVSRLPINPMTGVPMTGAPGGTLAIPSAHASDTGWPSPFGPRSFVALSTDFGGDRFTIGFATYMPYVQQITFPLAPNHDEPTRYHALALDLRNLELVPALSIRFGGDFRVGFAPGFVFSTGRLSFAEDLALDGGSSQCPPGTAQCVENPAAAARYDISSGNGLGDAKFSVTLGAGLYYRRRAFEAGLAYQSRPLGSDVPGVEVAGKNTTVTLPPRDPMGGGGLLACPNGQTDHCIFGDLSYRLPDVWIAGATWHLGPGLELSAMVRWLWFHVHDRIDIRLSGPTLDADNHDIPQHVVLYRGFKNVWDTRVRISYWWRERIRIGGMLRLETSAVDANAVNAAAVDGFKIEPVGLIEVRLLKQIWLGGGYGITFMPAVDVTDSAFKPELATQCADSGNNITTPNGSCQARDAGKARPTAAGHYTMRSQDFGMTVTFKF